ncbi:MAG: hypothetical protein ACJ72A_24140 [Nocardioidaceae bacterium]
MNASTVTRISHTGFETTPTGRRLSVAGATYVAAWITGLLTGPTTPAVAGPDSAIHEYYLQQGPAIVLQSSLIHGLAGAALLVLAWTIPAAATLASTRLRRSVIILGSAAALVSCVQVAFAVAGVSGAPHDEAGTSAALLDAIDVADTAKLVLLAGFAATATVAAAREGMVPRWVRALTTVLVVLLPVGGLAFLVDSAALTGMLYASLPLLLAWAAAIAYFVGRRAH